MNSEAQDSNLRAEVQGYQPAAYGDRLGADYDTLYPASGLETEATVDFLADLAERHPNRSVLEFGIGTGRLAIELCRRGLRVAGIEASERMVAALRAKAPDAQIEIGIGDYVSTRIAGEFSVVALVFNNILDPRGLPAQLGIFQNAGRHLAPGGCFVVEAFVLSDEAKSGSWTVSPRSVGVDHVELQLARFDIETSTLERTLVHLTPEGPEFVSVLDSYAGPAELDVMAHVNGMTRTERYSSWSRAPFTALSRRHISYCRPRAAITVSVSVSAAREHNGARNGGAAFTGCQACGSLGVITAASAGAWSGRVARGPSRAQVTARYWFSLDPSHANLGLSVNRR